MIEVHLWRRIGLKRFLEGSRSNQIATLIDSKCRRVPLKFTRGSPLAEFIFAWRNKKICHVNTAPSTCMSMLSPLSGSGASAPVFVDLGKNLRAEFQFAPERINRRKVNT